MSSAQLDNVLKRLNFFRKLDSLSPVTFSSSSNAMAQKAALMMRVNNELNHTPPSTWKCYSSNGAAAAMGSNLSWNTMGEPYMSIDQWMDDPGNDRSGHRRWNLYSDATVYGFGSTGDFCCLYWASSKTTVAKKPSSITWPCKGYCPAPLVYERWSFGVPKADFTNATVQMTQNGTNISLSIDPLQQGYGDNSIIWLPSGINVKSSSDITYHVKITGVVVSGVSRNYEYDVTIIQP